jgi:hypothetical protein
MEIVLALGILSIVLVALGGLMYQVSYQTRGAAARSYLSAARQSAATRVEGTPWDSLTSLAFIGCITDTVGQLVYDRCTTEADSAKLRRIEIVLTPVGNLRAPPETVVVYRVKPSPIAPFRP